MFRSIHKFSVRLAAILVGLLVLGSSAEAQNNSLRLPNGLRNVPASTAATTTNLATNEKMTLAATLEWEEGHTQGKLVVTAKMIPGWHVYSMDQVGGPGPTKIKIEEAVGVKLKGAFTPDRAPDVSESTAWPGVMIEEYSDEVSWSAPFVWESEQPGPVAKFLVRFDGICCDSNAGCVPYMNKKLTAEWINPDPQVAAKPATKTEQTPTSPATAAVAPPALPANFAALKLDQTKIDELHSTLSGSLDRSQIKPGDKLTLQFKFDVDEEFHVYEWHKSVPKGLNFSPTLIKLQPLPGFKIVDFQASLPVSEKDFQGVQVAYYDGPVEFNVVLQASESVAAGEYTVRGALSYQTCDANSCDPPTGAAFSQTFAVVADDSAAQATAKPLSFAKAKYRLADKELLDWASPEVGLEFAAAIVGSKTETSVDNANVGNPDSAGNATAGNSSASNANSNGSEGVSSHGSVGTEVGSNASPTYSLRLQDIKSRGVSQDHLSIPMVLAFALLGGFILNFMPCVLPVIGLKVMSFVQQAGSDRFQAFMLNVWYTAGILSVFMILATMLAFFNFGWGQQSQFAGFQIGLSAIVFVMALSFLGVWEIPIPGFVGSSKAAQAAEREGPMAAVIKGVITTILAVPCSGPALATALAWCTGKPAYLVYMVFLFMGLGMALPYIVLGLNPGLVKLIPRPGMWMEQFKEFMGFVLLGTVIWLLWTIPISLMLPAVAFLFGLWFACWWIGSTSITASSGRKAFSWLVAIAVSIGTGWFAFYQFTPVLEGKLDREIASRIQEGFKVERGGDHLAWEPYTFATLAEHAEQGRTVMVDFTADWCATCKVLESTVLNTKLVREQVEQLGIVPLMADWTDMDESIKEMLTQLGSQQIPVLAVFPANKPTEPIVLIGGYTQSKLLEVLQEAGPSKSLVNDAAGNRKVSLSR